MYCDNLYYNLLSTVATVVRPVATCAATCSLHKSYVQLYGNMITVARTDSNLSVKPCILSDLYCKFYVEFVETVAAQVQCTQDIIMKTAGAHDYRTAV